MASIQMRELINNILQDTTRDMREQADRVENAFGKRIEEMAGAKAKMENQLENVCVSSFFNIYLLEVLQRELEIIFNFSTGFDYCLMFALLKRIRRSNSFFA